MCPDPQILSIYMDGELPSPWKEKMEKHLTECSVCKEKYDDYIQMRELFKKSTNQRRTIVDLDKHISEENILNEQEQIEASKQKIWRSLESRQRFRIVRHANLLSRRLSVPLPIAAAAAIIVVLFAAYWLRIGSVNNKQDNELYNFLLAAEEEIPVVPMDYMQDMNSVLQYLSSNGTEIIILNLPDNRNFSRTGDPAIIRAADYSRIENAPARRQP